MKSDPTGKASRERNLAIEKDRSEGHTLDWIAYKYGISKQRVFQILVKVREDRQSEETA